MFTGLQPATLQFRRYRGAAVSSAAHLTLLAALVWQSSQVIEISPAGLAHGEGIRNYKLIYLPSGDQKVDSAPPESAKLLYPMRVSKPRPLPESERKHPDEPQQALAEADSGDHASHAGSPLGTLIDGPITGHEVHVAYPTIYPDPPVDRAGLPRDLVGDVIIEVTIDSQGAVVETKVVQAIGHGIDEKIVATLRHWHYQPATLDGTPVASRHDVYFHFPS